MHRKSSSASDLAGDAEMQAGAGADVEQGGIDGDVSRRLSSVGTVRPPARLVDNHIAGRNPTVEGAAGLEVGVAAEKLDRKAKGQAPDDGADGGANRNQAQAAGTEETAVAMIIVMFADTDMFMAAVMMIDRSPLGSVPGEARGAFFPSLGRVVPAVGQGVAGQGGGGNQAAYQKRGEVSGSFHGALL